MTNSKWSPAGLAAYWVVVTIIMLALTYVFSKVLLVTVGISIPEKFMLAASCLISSADLLYKHQHARNRK